MTSTPSAAALTLANVASTMRPMAHSITRGSRALSTTLTPEAAAQVGDDFHTIRSERIITPELPNPTMKNYMFNGGPSSLSTPS